MDLFTLFAETANDGSWRLGIGDPTPMGWATVFAYFAASILCGIVTVADWRNTRSGRAGCPWFWLVLTVLLALLGINKQLDLQTLLTQTGRDLALSQGWYEKRRNVQAAFIAVVLVLGLISLAGFAWLARSQPRRTVTSFLGMVFLFVFVLLRASSFNHIDRFLDWRVLGWRWNWILELGGIAIVGLGVFLALRSSRKPAGAQLIERQR